MSSPAPYQLLNQLVFSSNPAIPRIANGIDVDSGSESEPFQLNAATDLGFIQSQNGAWWLRLPNPTARGPLQLPGGFLLIDAGFDLATNNLMVIPFSTELINNNEYSVTNPLVANTNGAWLWGYTDLTNWYIKFL